MTGHFTARLGVVKSKDGKVFTEAREIKDRWKGYTEDLYRRDANMQDVFQEVPFSQEPIVTENEIKTAMRSIANEKSAGVDNIPIELFKSVGDEAVRLLTVLCQKIWKTSR